MAPFFFVFSFGKTVAEYRNQNVRGKGTFLSCHALGCAMGCIGCADCCSALAQEKKITLFGLLQPQSEIYIGEDAQHGERCNTTTSVSSLAERGNGPQQATFRCISRSSLLLPLAIKERRGLYCVSPYYGLGPKGWHVELRKAYICIGKECTREILII